MQRERVTESIIVFTSQLYARVTAGVVLTDSGAVLIDTLAFPKESLAIKRFVEERLSKTVEVVVNTHYHADHTNGTCFFEDAQVVAHNRCRDLLDTRGRAGLSAARESSTEMDGVELILPDVVFDQAHSFRVGGKTFHLWASPGHSPDSIVCLVEEDQVLFAGDTLMALPHFYDGDINDLRGSLYGLKGQTFEMIVQGHGEIVLRGEMKSRIQKDLDYLDRLEQMVDNALTGSDVEEALNAINIQSCGKSRVLLNGAAEQLHRQNINWLVKHHRMAIRETRTRAYE